MLDWRAMLLDDLFLGGPEEEEYWELTAVEPGWDDHRDEPKAQNAWEGDEDDAIEDEQDDRDDET